MIICKSSAEIEKLRRSGRVVRQVLGEIREQVRPGVTTLDLGEVCGPAIQRVGGPARI